MLTFGGWRTGINQCGPLQSLTLMLGVVRPLNECVLTVEKHRIMFKMSD